VASGRRSSQERASVDSVLFAVQLVDWSAVDVLDARLAALSTFYAPLGSPIVEAVRMSELRLVGAQIHFGEHDLDYGRLLVWGGPLPPELASARALLDAGNRELRSINALTAAFAADDGQAALVSGSAGIATLHSARGELGTAWATHAVAAAWLATGRVEVEHDGIPELLTRGFIGDERTLIRGVKVEETALRVRFTPERTAVAPYWPASERWELMPEPEAQEAAERALIDGLAQRAGQLDSPFVALTAGIDSRTVAVALREAGVPIGAFTWGEPEWDDVIGARVIAEALGIEHRHQALDWRDDASALGFIDAEARWNEGATPVRFIVESYPQEMSAVVNGMGGEIGRAFFYDASHALVNPEPDLAHMARVFRARRPAHVSKDRLDALHARELGWLGEAHSLGPRGWRCLDVVYAEQRVRKWGRAMLPRLGAAFTPGFATPNVARALVSAPLVARTTDGIHRRFLESRAPAIAPGAPPGPRRPTRMTARLPGARRLRAMLRRAATRREPWLAHESWSSYPQLRAWVAEDALASPLLRDAMGEPWLEHTRAGFLGGRREATRDALLAAAPVALERALHDLEPSD
jgi:hypothetical protein